MGIGYIIQETTAAACNPKIISDTGSVLKFNATIQDYEENRNRRLYRKATLQEGFKSTSVMEKLATRTFYGEANHPFSQDVSVQTVVDFLRASHLVTGYEFKSSTLDAEIETLANTVGKDIRAIIVENKSQVAFSLRAAASITKPVPGKSGITEICGPITIIAYDLVTFPSHKTAYMMKENSFLHELHAKDFAKHVANKSADLQYVMESLNVFDYLSSFDNKGNLVTEAYSEEGKSTIILSNTTQIRNEFNSLFK